MKKKQVLIFGATSEISLHFSMSFLSDGYDLLLSSSNQARLSARALALNKSFPQNTINLLPLDLTDPVETEIVLSQLEKLWSNIEIICLCMGLNEESLADVTNPSVINNIVQINYLSTTRIISTALEVWSKAGLPKKIFYTSTVAAIRPLNHFVYSSSKVAAEYYIRGLKMERKFNFVQFYIFRIGQINDSPQTFLGILTATTSSNVSKKIIYKLRKKGGLFYIPGRWYLISRILLLFPDIILSYIKKFLKSD